MYQELNISKTLAPEDIVPGTYVAVTSVLAEYLWLNCGEQPWKSRVEIVRVRWLPPTDQQPLKVLEVCLPFVLVREPAGGVRTLDVRRYRLAQLREEYGKAAFKRLKSKSRRKLTLPDLI